MNSFYTERYGKGYDRSNLYLYLRFYKKIPGIVDMLCRQSGKLLSWSHYRALLQVEDEKARAWYEKEALEQTWGVRTLQRNISSQYYVTKIILRKFYNYTLCTCRKDAIIITQCVIRGEIMECSKKIKELRESTGMNRKEFCEYFQIPYRTVTEWERDNRHAPKYVLHLLEYYIRMEKMTKDEEQKYGRKNGVDNHR